MKTKFKEKKEEKEKYFVAECFKSRLDLKSSHFNNYVPTGAGTSNFSKRVLCFFDTSVRYSFPFVISTLLYSS